jgi:hypothetical protein
MNLHFVLLAANEAALRVPTVRFASSSLSLLREVKTLVTSEGTNVTQTMIRVGPSFQATAIGTTGEFQIYEHEIAPRGSGWEYIESVDMRGNAERWAALAAEKVSAKSVEPGQYDLILDPTNLWLTIHESIGHSTELDRAIGEGQLRRHNFVAPPEKMIGQLRFGPAFMNIRADRTQEDRWRASRGTTKACRPTTSRRRKGLFKDYQTTREQVARIQKLTGVSKSPAARCRIVEPGAVPADAEYFADAGRTRSHARRHRRGHERRIVVEPRIVVDRSPAVQLPVLGTGVLRSSRRQDRRHAEDVAYQSNADLLELHGHDWRTVVLLDGRILQRRKRRALAG